MLRTFTLPWTVVCLLALSACAQSPETVLSPSAVTDSAATLNADGSTVKASAPRDLSPNGGVIDTRRPTLSFTNASGRFQAIGFSYEVEVQNAAGTVVYSRVIGQSPTSSSHTLDIELGFSETFWWRSRGRLDAETAPWSEFAMFTTPDPPPPPPPPPAPTPSPGEPHGLPVGDPVVTVIAAMQEIERRFPGLRQQGTLDWIEKVVYLGSLADPRIGHSSSHSDTRATRRNELGIRDGADVIGGRQSYRSVNLFQIDPPRDSIRLAPIVEPKFDFWFPQAPVPLR